MTVPEILSELLPEQAVVAPDRPARLELRGVAGEGELRVTRLGVLRETRRVGSGVIDLGVLEPGGWGVSWSDGTTVLRTALDVRDGSAPRLRYGFTATYRPGRDVEELLDTVRRLHLTHVQCYDWAYRHADLLGGGESYRDPLGGEISLETVRAIADGLVGIGSAALGYAAVYGVGAEEWPAWRDGALQDAVGEAVSLGDFLRIVDPAWEPWTRHLVDELQAALGVGFAGFHLDQYGWPKVARRADGVVVDVAASFVQLIARLRAALPTAQLVFNNVNDFPTPRTAGLPLDAVYIEPWEPNIGLSDLARIADRARRDGDGKPVVLAAYQHCYETSGVAEADEALRLTQATLLSHGATQLIAGEDGRILTDPYYVRNREAAASTWAILREHADFAVEYDALLLDPDVVDVTDTVTGGYNDDCDVVLDGVAVTRDPQPGAVWRRVTGSGSRFVVHLIDLVAQRETGWDTPKAPAVGERRGVLRVRRLLGARPRVRLLRPGADPVELGVRDDGTHAAIDLAYGATAWTVLQVELDPEWTA